MRTFGSFGCTGVFVIMWKKLVRSSHGCSCAHGVAAVHGLPLIVTFVGAISGSSGWTMFGSRYVPGQFVFSGSPLPDVVKMKNCALDASPHTGGV